MNELDTAMTCPPLLTATPRRAEIPVSALSERVPAAESQINPSSGCEQAQVSGLRKQEPTTWPCSLIAVAEQVVAFGSKGMRVTA